MSSKQIEGNQTEVQKRDRRGLWTPSFLAGLVLILIGTLMLLQELDWLGTFGWWQYFLIGLGIVLIIDALVRFRKPGRTGRLSAGLWLTVIGVLFILGFDRWWPVLLVTAGVWVVLNRLLK